MGRLIGEDDGYIAFGKAGLDKNFTLFKIYTGKLKDEKTGEEIGRASCRERVSSPV